MLRETEQSREERRYPALSTISVAFRILAYVVGVLGVITAIFAPFTLAEPFITELGAVIGILLITLLQAFIYYAIGDYLQVIMDIEYNTFKTNQTIEQQAGMPPAARRA